MRPTNGLRARSRNWSAAVALMAALLAAPAFGRVRYLSPVGVDVLDGGTSSGTAWRTFPFALAQLEPGDVLLVEPGTWTWVDGGVLNADCTASARNGLADAGITVRAATERQARIVSNGSKPAVELNQCSYWTVDGLFAEGGDFRGGRSTVEVTSSAHVTLRRLLVSKDNRYDNTMPIVLSMSSDALVEECEVYDYFRVAVEVWHTTGAVVRRVYANPRGRRELDGGYRRYSRDFADQTFSIHSPGVLVENCVSEAARAGILFYTDGDADDGRYLGDVSVGGLHGLLFQSGQDRAYGERNLVQDFLAFRPAVSGIDFRDTRESRAEGCTVFQSAGDGVVATTERAASTLLSAYASRTLVTGLDAGAGFLIEFQSAFGLSDVNSFGFSAPFSPSGGPELQRTTSLEPGLGACPLMIPETSPMKRAARDGGDIGANLLYRYQNGVLTTAPLWSPGFPCGAIVAGVNDVPDASCFDLHLRLGVGSCAFPQGYLSAQTDGGLTFTTEPERQLVCGAAWRYTPNVSGDSPVVFTLDGTAPGGITVDAATGTVDWTPTRAEAGDLHLVLNARTSRRAGRQDLDLVVRCTPTTLGVACGCDANSGLVASLTWLVWLARRRSSTHNARS